MNYFKNINYLIVTALLLAVAGCNDILDETEPPTSVSGDIALNSEEAVNGIRNSMYSQLRSNFGYATEYFVGPSAFADETRSRVGASRFQDLNDAEGTFGTVHLRPYDATYSIILDANLLINAIDEDVLSESDYDRFRGEAYAIRAFALHHLSRSLGYEPSNTDMGPESDWDLSVIIRNEPTLDIEDADQRERNTVDEVYDQILSDLEESKNLLSNFGFDRNRVSEPFVDALTARVHLYAGNWQQAADAAQEAITNSGLDLVNTESGVAGMFDEGSGNHPEALFLLQVDPNTEPFMDEAGNASNTNNSPAAYTSTQWVAQVPTQMVLDLYEDEDFRIGEFIRDEEGDIIVDENGLRQYEGGWYRPCYDDTEDDPQSGCDAVNEEELSTNKWNGGNGNLSDNLPYMRLAEVYLIYAEAVAKAGNLPDGVDALNELREARGASELDGFSDAFVDFEDAILEERMRELIVEGHRFWDLKRLGRDIRNPDGSLKMSANSYRILANIGGDLLSANPELVENPGYN